jgi:3-oxoacyl-[acyl-carrier protein] reductase
MITGASKGIGREAALLLASANSEFERLVLVGRQSDHFEKTIADLRKLAGNKDIVKIEADLDDPDVVNDVFETLKERDISLNVIVNNAGFTKPASISETKMDDFEKTMRVNVYSPFRIVQMALHYNHPLNQIINIASTAGITGRAGWLSYSASKAAMINMSEVLRDELKPYGIEVVCLSPGRCATDLRRQLAPDEDQSTIMQPQQLAEVIRLMTSSTGMLLHSQNLVVRA